MESSQGITAGRAAIRKALFRDLVAGHEISQDQVSHPSFHIGEIGPVDTGFFRCFFLRKPEMSSTPLNSKAKADQYGIACPRSGLPHAGMLLV